LTAAAARRGDPLMRSAGSQLASTNDEAVGAHWPMVSDIVVKFGWFTKTRRIGGYINAVRLGSLGSTSATSELSSRRTGSGATRWCTAWPQMHLLTPGRLTVHGGRNLPLRARHR